MSRDTDIVGVKMVFQHGNLSEGTQYGNGYAIIIAISTIIITFKMPRCSATKLLPFSLSIPMHFPLFSSFVDSLGNDYIEVVPQKVRH